MATAYNFLASWQLFPERCTYENGLIPKSGICKIESGANNNELIVAANWVSVDNVAYNSEYRFVPDGANHKTAAVEMATEVQALIKGSHEMAVTFFLNAEEALKVNMQILPNGYLCIRQQGTTAEGKSFTNTEVYHKQLSVLPYASSAGSVAIRPTKAGVIKHKALSAMEEQTDMQLNQIRQQIELLAEQAQEITKRRELSLLIYDAKISFKPQIGQTYHLYEKKDGSHTLSLVSPADWGGNGPYQNFLASVKLLADHTWKEINPRKEKAFEDLEFE